MANELNVLLGGSIGFPKTKDDSDVFQRMCLNPKNLDNQNDQLFQILKFLRKDLSSKEIISLITEYCCSKGVMRMDSSQILSFLNQYLPFPYIGLKYGQYKAYDFAKNDYLRFKKDDTEWLVVKMGRQIELFSMKTGKFYGSHMINEYAKISGFWKCGGFYG